MRPPRFSGHRQYDQQNRMSFSSPHVATPTHGSRPYMSAVKYNQKFDTFVSLLRFICRYRTACSICRWGHYSNRSRRKICRRCASRRAPSNHASRTRRRACLRKTLTGSLSKDQICYLLPTLLVPAVTAIGTRIAAILHDVEEHVQRFCSSSAACGSC